MKRLITLLATVAIVVGVNGQECNVCVPFPFGIQEDCYDPRLYEELKLEVKRTKVDDYRNRHPDGGWYKLDAIKISHSGTRIQWSTNSIDWNFFNYTVLDGTSYNYGFTWYAGIGNHVPIEYVGKINWKEGGWEGPKLKQFFVRLYPCDVKVHKEAHKNSKITFSATKEFRWSDLRLCLEWNYGRLQRAKSIDPFLIDWEDLGGRGKSHTWHCIYPNRERVKVDNINGVLKRITNSVINKEFYRIEPLDENAFKTFYIDIDEAIVKEHKPELINPADTSNGEIGIEIINE